VGSEAEPRILDVWGDTNLHGGFGLTGNMYVTDNHEVAGSTIVHGHTDVGSLRVKGQTDLNGNVGVGGSMYVTDKHEVGGNTKVHGQADIGGGSLSHGVSVGMRPPSMPESWQYGYEAIGIREWNGNLRLQSPQGILLHPGNALKDTIAIFKDHVNVGAQDQPVSLDVNGPITVRYGRPLIKIRRLRDLVEGGFTMHGSEYNFHSLDISVGEYYCTIGGFATMPGGTANNLSNWVWTVVRDGIWHVVVDLPGQGDTQQPDVDVVCFATEIVDFGGTAGTDYFWPGW
jgi:hypothetical protein